MNPKHPDDLILYWPNGDAAVRFQSDGPFISIAEPGASVLDSFSMPLAPDRVEALREWCEGVLG